MSGMRVLIVEDELRMASLIHRGLVKEGLAADVAERGEDALWMAGAHDHDAIVLDVMLPEMNGFETCRQLRNNGVWAPVLMLTARDSVQDRVAGLDTGADDYETLARLRDELLVAGPIAILLASLAGYFLAGLALRPVESMRRRVAAISRPRRRASGCRCRRAATRSSAWARR